MIQEQRLEAVIFDMDGTLFQTERVAIPACHRTFRKLRQEGLYNGEPPTDEQVQSVFGLTQPEIWEKLLPEASEEVRKRADRWWLEYELDCIREGMGSLYPGVDDGIRELHRRGWKLFIASNGLGPYVRGILDHYDLNPYFSGIYTAGEHNTAKKEALVEKLLREHRVGGGYMVGDRSSDVRAGKANGLTVVGCRYAGYPQFGDRDELAGADRVIDSFQALPRIVGHPSITS